MIRIAFAMTVLLAGCATTPKPDPFLTGSWGAAHVGLTLDAAGGKLGYDCAAGTINRSVILDGQGEFHERGTHSPGTGGPDREGVVPQSYPALYHGSVSGDRMILRVIVPTQGLVLGPYELRRDAQPLLTRCL
jgi:hypothetical protein